MACSTIAALNAAMDGGFILNPEGRVVYRNSVAKRIFGGSNVADSEPISSFVVFREATRETGMDNAVLWNALLNDLESGKPKQLDAKAYASDKSSFPAIVSLTKLGKCECPECCRGRRGERDDDGDNDNEELPQPQPQLRAFIAYVREVDDQLQRYLRLLEKENKRLQTAKFAMEASFDAFVSINSKGIIQSVNEAAVTAFQYSREEFIGSNVSMITGGEHPEKHDQYLRNYMKTGVKKVMGKKRELPARRKDGTEFSIELGLIEIGASSGIEDERLFCGFIKDLSAHKDSISAVDAMIDASLDAMFQIDESGIIQMANAAASSVLGWSRHEFLGRNINMVVGDSAHARNHDRYIQAYLQTGEKRVMGKRRELDAVRKDGTKLVIELELTEIIKSTGDRLFCGFLRDLTMQKEKEKLTIGMIESSFDPMIQIDTRGIIQLCNTASCDIFGYSRAELVGENVRMIVGGVHSKQHDKYLARYLATGEKRVMGKRRELPARRKDGSEFQIELGLTEVKLATGEVYFCGFVKDLSEQKLNEQKIRQKQELTEGMIHASFDPMFEINQTGTIISSNQAAIDQFGYPKDELIGMNISRLCGAGHGPKHDGYLARYIQTGEKRVMGKRRQTMARRKDGSEFPIELGVSEVRTDSGEQRIYCGYTRDIRREKYDEQDLKEKEKLSDAFIEQAPDPLFSVDEHGSIHRTNLAAARYFGWTKDAMIGNSIKMIMSANFAERSASDFGQFIRSSVGKSREIEIKKHDGSLGTVNITVEDIKGEFPILLSLSPGGRERGNHLFVIFMHAGKNAPLGLMGKFVGSLVGETDA